MLLLNLVMILLVMSPSFRRQVAPALPVGMREAYYSVSTVHAALGTLAEFLGVYIMLVVGTKLIPERFRFKRWKLWMRTELALWWLVLLLGVGTYWVWYRTPESLAATSQAASGRVAVKLSNFDFTPKEVTIQAGSTVEWVNDGGRHSVVADDGSFKSETLKTGDKFERTFDKPGTYPYYCGFHGDKAGKDMAGVVRVTR